MCMETFKKYLDVVNTDIHLKLLYKIPLAKEKDIDFTEH